MSAPKNSAAELLTEYASDLFPRDLKHFHRITEH